jgi:hypothetical protein
VSNRREFLKQAGVLSTVSWSRSSLSHRHPTSPEPSAVTAMPPEAGSIVLENAEMRLVISPNGSAQSLVGSRDEFVFQFVVGFGLVEEGPRRGRCSPWLPGRGTV